MPNAQQVSNKHTPDDQKTSKNYPKQPKGSIPFYALRFMHFSLTKASRAPRQPESLFDRGSTGAKHHISPLPTLQSQGSSLALPTHSHARLKQR